MKKLLIVGMMMMMVLVGISSGSRLAMSIRDENNNPVYDIILQELKSSGSVGKECYSACKSEADCCAGQTTCPEYKYKPYCVWCPGEGKQCGYLDKCCPGYRCIDNGSLFNGVCKPKSWCPKQGERCDSTVRCCPGYKCTGFITRCTKE